MQNANLGLSKPSQRSYWGFEPHIKIVSVKQFKNKETFTPTEKRLLENELSGIEPVDHIIILNNRNKKFGEFTRRQVNEILIDMGFNVTPKMSGSHESDFTALMNVKGFIFPWWNKFIDVFPDKLEKLLLTRYSPGKERLHIRVYENNDGTWIITAHTDLNWLNFNLYEVYKAHLTQGAGNYRMGVVLMLKLFEKFNENIAQDDVMSVSKITGTTKKVYREGIDDFYKALN